MSLEYRIGDVVERLAEIPDGSIDLIVTSPPFLALRSYLPADHPDKAKEIGSEPTPAAFIDTLLGLSAEFARVLAPHGSICVELGDTYSGGNKTEMVARDAPQDEGGYIHAEGRVRREGFGHNSVAGIRNMDDKHQGGGPGWPLAKSLTGIPTLYTWSLAYGRNLLTGSPSPAGQWRIRNVIVWARPNPPVGALGDKFRPATSYITVACKGPRRYFDLDAVRTEHLHLDSQVQNGKRATNTGGNRQDDGGTFSNIGNPAGAPPLDWHADDHPEDGDWLWKLSTQPYAGSHYATYPMKLPKRLIEAMCPLKVCTVCGKASERVTERDMEATEASSRVVVTKGGDRSERHGRATTQQASGVHIPNAINVTTGYTDCSHDAWRTGVVLDPFAGSGTTLEAAQAVGRHAIGIDLDARNADLAQQRVGMFLTVTERAA
jgi:DNA modification methylase